ncbi:MAG: methyltransferase [Alphaproteobacteria bacterium GM7ARS4]|nr:methyltransferase [Alphaproteobacteria bacterium GM7ARS4]
MRDDMGDGMRGDICDGRGRDGRGESLLGGRLSFRQPPRGQGYRAPFDGVFLAACVPLASWLRGRRGQRGMSRRVSSMRPLRCLDMGMGTGMVSLCLLSRAQRARMALHVTGIETQHALLPYARRNLADNGFSTHAQVLWGDMRVAKPLMARKRFDIVMVNPPWRDGGRDGGREGGRQGGHKRACQHAPRHPQRACAFMLGDSTLGEWVSSAVRYAKPDGMLCLIVHADHTEHVTCVLRRLGWHVAVRWFLYGRSHAHPIRTIFYAHKAGDRRGGYGARSNASSIHHVTLHEFDGRFNPVIEGVLRHGSALAGG